MTQPTTDTADTDSQPRKRIAFLVTVDLIADPGAASLLDDAGRQVGDNINHLLQRFGIGEGMLTADTEQAQGACILTPENMHTADDCTMHDHESAGTVTAESVTVGGPFTGPDGFAIVEMADIELTGVHLFTDESHARAVFDQLCEENKVTPHDESDLSREASGTLALAGDDAYSVQLIRRPIS